MQDNFGVRSAVNQTSAVHISPENVDANVDGGRGKNGRLKKCNNYGVFEEREKGFELSQGLEIPQRVRRVARQVRETMTCPPSLNHT